MATVKPFFYFRQMKKILLFFLCCAFTTSVVSQNAKKNSAKDFKNYMNAIQDKDVDKVMSYHPDFLFQAIPKKQVKEEFEKTHNNPGVTFHIKKYKIEKLGKTIKGDSLFYKVIRYKTSIETRLAKIDDKSAKDKEAFNRLHEMRLLSQYGFGNVTLNKKTGFFEIQERNKVCAISKDGVNDWKFIVLEYKHREALQKLLPTKLYKEFD